MFPQKISFKQKPPKGFVTPEKAEHHAEILSNRVLNRYRHFSRKYRKQNIDCFRLYDWDIPEVRAVVDWYAGQVVIAEYVRIQTTADWLPRMAKAVGDALGLPPEKVHSKQRRTKTEEGPRYSKLNSTNERFPVNERDLKLWVNLEDYLDTGLFSDHRDTRQLVKQYVAGKNFLNLFAYTGAFTCAAALGKAKSTVTVDRSDTYIEWAKDNLALNNLSGPQHTFVQSDVQRFLNKMHKEGKKFNYAVVDPPSFFQDTAHDISFDINVDHPQLLLDVFKIMEPGSTVIFSTNHQDFEPQLDHLPIRFIKELTPATIPEDYRNRLIHRCWRMTTA